MNKSMNNNQSSPSTSTNKKTTQEQIATAYKEGVDYYQALQKQANKKDSTSKRKPLKKWLKKI